jgi:hypothetical protein
VPLYIHNTDLSENYTLKYRVFHKSAEFTPIEPMSCKCLHEDSVWHHDSLIIYLRPFEEFSCRQQMPPKCITVRSSSTSSETGRQGRRRSTSGFLWFTAERRTQDRAHQAMTSLTMPSAVLSMMTRICHAHIGEHLE